MLLLYHDGRKCISNIENDYMDCDYRKQGSGALVVINIGDNKLQQSFAIMAKVKESLVTRMVRGTFHYNLPSKKMIG